MRIRDGGDGAWRESTEGDLDPDLTEEAGRDLADWERPAERARRVTVSRIAIGVALVAFVVAVVAGRLI